ncbi:MAG: phosphatase PAP2 family protein [Oscillospiraceae bacterium]|nr:phosphatase PAP2 family protein [Oscillospiraceae bacterium]
MLFLDAVVNAPGSYLSFDWEITLMEWLQAHLSPGAINAISQLSMFGEELLLIVVMGFFYWCFDKETGKFIGLNFLAANVWGPMIKNLVLRFRPYMYSDKIDLLRKIDADAPIEDVLAQGYSFPSGHSAGAVSVYGSAARRRKGFWLTLLAFLLPLLVGFSRVVVGAHFPTDVFAGWALGLIVILFIPWLRKKINNRLVFSLVMLLSTVPGFFFCTSTDYFSSFGMLVGFLLAEPFEERFVRFENTRSVIRSILRIAGGGAIYFALRWLLKLPFPEAVLEAGDLAAHLIRAGRYAIVIFVVIGVYPAVFKLTARIGAKKNAEQT